MVTLNDIYTITPINEKILEDSDYNGMYTMPYQCKLTCDYALGSKFDSLIKSVDENWKNPTCENLQALSHSATEQAIYSFLATNIQNIVIFYCLKYVEDVVEKSEVDITGALNLRNEMYQAIVSLTSNLMSDLDKSITENAPTTTGLGLMYPVGLSLFLSQIVSQINIYVIEPMILALYGKIYTDHRICTTLYKNYIDENTDSLAAGVTSSGWQAITGILRELMEPYFFQISSAIILLSEPANNMLIGDNQGEAKKYDPDTNMEEYVTKDPIIIDILDLYEDDEE